MCNIKTKFNTELWWLIHVWNNFFVSFFCRFIDFSAPQSGPVSKARVFEPSELVQAYKKIDVNNCYELVRAALGIVGYYGANRMAEIQEMKMSGNDLIIWQ